MTDSYSSLTVVLEENLREEDLAKLRVAILQLRGVLHVTGNKVNPGEYAAESRARFKVLGELIKQLQDQI